MKHGFLKSQIPEENQLSLPQIHKRPEGSSARVRFHVHVSFSMPGFCESWSYVGPETLLESSPVSGSYKLFHPLF